MSKAWRQLPDNSDGFGGQSSEMASHVRSLIGQIFDGRRGMLFVISSLVSNMSNCMVFAANIHLEGELYYSS
jgi:hypothetical protein